MSDSNRISATLTDDDVTAILGAIDTIRTKLPFLISVSNEERGEIPKLGDKSMGFEEKCSSYMTSNPEFLPGFVPIAEVTKDRALLGKFMQFWPKLTTLCEDVADTKLVIGSEIYMADLAYYQNVRQGAKRGLPGADTIYNDLRVRFPGNSPQPPAPVQP